jgi:hypothetical protein
MIRSFIVTITLAAIAMTSAHAHNTATKPEQANSYRHGLYGAIAWNFGPLNAMAQEKAPFDKNEASIRSARVAALAEMLPEAFPEGSAIKGKSEAKAAIWEHRAEFDALLKKFISKAAALNEGAKNGDFEKFKSLTLDTRSACKECHEKFKED